MILFRHAVLKNSAQRNAARRSKDNMQENTPSTEKSNTSKYSAVNAEKCLHRYVVGIAPAQRNAVRRVQKEFTPHTGKRKSEKKL